MSEFWTYVIKEFKHILRDRRTLFVLLGIPIAQILLFGFALTNEVKNSKFAVLDLSKDEQTRLITERLAASQFFDLAEHLTSYDQIERSFQAGHSNLVVVFPAGFAV